MAEDAAALTDIQAKLFTLARAARARTQASDGAAVVDETGRTYSAAGVVLPHLQLSAVELAVAAAAASGAQRLASCVVVGASAEPDVRDTEVFGDLAEAGAALILCRPDATVAAAWTSP